MVFNVHVCNDVFACELGQLLLPIRLRDILCRAEDVYRLDFPFLTITNYHSIKVICNFLLRYQTGR